MGVSVAGMAEEPAGQKKETRLGLYLAKHPYLEEFVRSPDSALVGEKAHILSVLPRAGVRVTAGMRVSGVAP